MSSKHYQQLFASLADAGVYHLPHGSIDELAAGAHRAGCLVQHVNLRAVLNHDELLTALGQQLGFPNWFGHNWDALYDCLLDMGWRPAEGYVIILDHCDSIHARAENDFVMLTQIFQQAADEWREQGVPFWCLIDMQSDGIAWLPTVNQPAP